MIVIGAKGRLDIERALQEIKKRGLKGQILDASVVCGKEHLEVAYDHARRAFEEGRNKSRSIEMEFLLYASTKRQIKEAIEFIGAKNEGEYAFVFFEGEEKEAREFVRELGLEIDDAVLEPNIEKLKKFVDERELETVDKTFYFDLIFEKVAMVEPMK
ncbi:MAG: hypothetical protein J7L58_06765 [Thermoplasmata archaeon]|nr:hypothetical protein [Thermoplasmata archaeon]